MSDPIFLGLSKDEWVLINSFGNWLSAIGTVAAVWVSLHLANRISTPKASVSVGHRIIVEPGGKKPFPEYECFKIVNTGERTIRVNQIGWKTGLFSKRYAVQLFDSILISSLPIELAHGQEANWYVPLDAKEEPWLIYFAKGILMPHHKIARVTLRAQFMTSVGYVFTAKPESNLLDKLKSACENQVAKS